MLSAIIPPKETDLKSSTPLTEAAPMGLDLAAVYNAQPGNLSGVDCPVCKNKGYVARLDENGSLTFAPCECQVQRRAGRRLEASGLGSLVEHCTFETYRTPEPWQRAVLAKARAFAADPRSPATSDSDCNWFYLCGPSGTGKTHLCTAICTALIRAGYDARYMLWRESAPQLKADVNGNYDRYAALMNELFNVRVLYIDDFLKGRISDGDIHVAFELINARYNRRDKAITIISSELDLGAITKLDEALGGRIYERAKNYSCRTGSENWRFRKTE